MKKRSMSLKMILMAVGISVIGLLIGIIGLFNTNTMNLLVENMYKQQVLGMELVGKLDVTMMDIRRIIYVIILTDNKADLQRVEKNFADSEKKFLDYIQDYKKLADNKKEQELIKMIEDGYKEYRNALDSIFYYTRQFKLKEAFALTPKVASIYKKSLESYLNELIKYNEDNALLAHEESKSVYKNSFKLIIGAIILGIAISLFLAVFMARGISKPIQRVVKNLSDSSEQITVSSTQLSSASQEIANGSTEQASSIQETSSAMEELSTTVKQNVSNAREASILADKSASESEKGYQEMEKMLSSMTEINKSSENIKKIIKVIEDIAFQTNVLALNASVEAARAGEAGMGFAVVAEEVKSLANKSSHSAKETADLINDTIKKTNDGLEISQRLSKILKELMTSIIKVSEMSKEVETAGKQQSEGIEQVNQAIIQLDTVVQSNAASAEETASSAVSLQGQVKALMEIVDDLTSIVNGNNSNKRKKNVSLEEYNQLLKKLEEIESSKNGFVKSHKSDEKKGKKEKKEAAGSDLISFEEDEEFKDKEK